MEEKKRSPKGFVTINAERCKGCGFCVEYCPLNVLKLSPEFNQKGYHYPIAYRIEICSGCDQCGSFCPDFAIFGTKFKDLELSTIS